MESGVCVCVCAPVLGLGSGEVCVSVYEWEKERASFRINIEELNCEENQRRLGSILLFYGYYNFA